MKTLLVVMSEGCNLDCSYCGVNKKSTATIDPALYLEEFRKLRAAQPNETIAVDFFGGEPLMQMPIVRQIIDGISSDGNVTMFMSTNGLLLTQPIVDYLVSSGVELSLSFDGLWQDKNRLQFTGKGTRQRLLDKKELICSIPNLKIHSMISRGCYNLLENYKFIQEHFGINAELTIVRDVGTWDMFSVRKLNAGITELIDWYIDNPNEDLPPFIKTYLTHFLSYHLTHEEKLNCGAGSSMFMFADNKLWPCTRFKQQPELLEQIPQYLSMSKCQTCDVRNYCNKGCLIEQIKNEGPIEELCTVYKHIYHEISRMSNKLQHNPLFIAAVTKEIENAN